MNKLFYVSYTTFCATGVIYCYVPHNWALFAVAVASFIVSVVGILTFKF